MGEDPLNVRFGEDWARLTRDLLFDSEGSLRFKGDLWSDVRKVILPALVDKVRFGFGYFGGVLMGCVVGVVGWVSSDSAY